MIKIFVAERGDSRYIARATSESGQTMRTGEERPTREAAIGALVLRAPDIFGVWDIVQSDKGSNPKE